ncbi:MAG: 4Fe-4S cluster-binding domain-containing protein [Candidatus Humimicrobiaceae bacterium]
MKILNIPQPVSMGLLLTYKCNISCKDCIYACSPKWKSDWIEIEGTNTVFSQLAPILNKSAPPYLNQISFSHGLHFTGGEPFLNFDLLLKLTGLARDKNIPLPFVETNCFWATSDDKTEEKLTQLKKAGLKGILVSINPFNIEYIPFERIERAARISEKIFGHNSIVYQQFYLNLFKKWGLKGTMPFKELVKKINPQKLQGYIELLPMGNTPYNLGNLYEK